RDRRDAPDHEPERGPRPQRQGDRRTDLVLRRRRREPDRGRPRRRGRALPPEARRGRAVRDDAAPLRLRVPRPVPRAARRAVADPAPRWNLPALELPPRASLPQRAPRRRRAGADPGGAARRRLRRGWLRDGARARAHGRGAGARARRLPRRAVPEAARDSRAVELAPLVPALGLEPCADALAVARAERPAGVAKRKPVDVGEVVVVLDPDDAADQRDMAIPRCGVEDGERGARVAAEEAEPEAA